MDINEIRELAKIANENNLESIELSSDDITLKIKVARGSSTETERSAPAKIITDAGSVPEKGAPAETPDAAADPIHEIKSPMVGVFYAAPSPDSEPYVHVGSRVSKGDVLCIIESMKLMNEITTDVYGEIARICVENSQVVEYGQPLFQIKHSE